MNLAFSGPRGRRRKLTAPRDTGGLSIVAGGVLIDVCTGAAASRVTTAITPFSRKLSNIA